MGSLARRLDGLVFWLMHGCRFAVVAITAWLTVVLVASVFARFVLNYSIAWVDESSALLLVWLMLAVAPLGFDENFHIAVGIIGEHLPRRWRDAVAIFINLGNIAFFSLTAWYGTLSTISDFGSPLFSIPIARGWATWVLPAASVVILIVCLRNLAALAGGESALAFRHARGIE